MGDHKRNPHAMNNTAPAPPQVVRDLYGRQLQVGDAILMTNGKPPRYIIADVKPTLDLRLPANTVIVTLVSQVTFPITANARIDQAVRVQTQEETGWLPPEQQAAEEAARAASTDGSLDPGKASTLIVE